MIRQAILATALVASLTGIASAQDAPPPPPPHGEAGGGPGMHRGPGHERGSEEYRDRWKEGAEQRRGPGPGPGGKRHSKGPDRGKPVGKGIEIKTGRSEASVRIECGDEPMAECLAAAKPVLDNLDRKGRGGPGKHRWDGGGRPDPKGEEAPQPM